ncbi:MAG: hypothetical protein ACQEP7_05760 [bacterium]
MSYLFMSDVLDWFSEGEVLRRIFSILLKVICGVFALLALYRFAKNWSFVTEVSFGGFLGLLWVQIIFVVASYMVLHTIWIRSNKISEIEAGRYTVIPIFSNLSRMMGEIYAVIAANVAVGGTVVLLFAGLPRPLSNLIGEVFPVAVPMMHPGYGAAGIKPAIGFFLGAVGAGLSFLVTFYLVAELLIVLVDIARNTAK